MPKSRLERILDGIRLGSPMGIPLILDSSFVLVILIEVFYMVRDHDIAEFWSLIRWLGVFALVTMHEYGHCYAARRYGHTSKQIRLYPFGGVAGLDTMPTEGKPAIVISIAGPLVNVAIAALAAAVYLVALDQQWGTLTTDIIEWLMVVNVVLVLFNLLPAFPMDGGRVFLAMLGQRMNGLRAIDITLWTARGLFLVMLGIGIYDKAWNLILIAALLSLGGKVELDQVRKRLRGW